MSDTPLRSSKAAPDRRSFLKAASIAGISAGFGGLPGTARKLLASSRTKATPSPLPGTAPDLTLRIAPVMVDLAEGLILSTIGYNGSAPGPVIRLKEGVPVTIDVHNDTDTPEFVHWHGQTLPAEVDGAMEEMTPSVPPHGSRRFRFTPGPAGSRWVHTHVMAMDDLNRGGYTGQFAFVYVEPKKEPIPFDQEVILVTHEWQPFYTHDEDEAGMGDMAPDPNNGWEVGYQRFTINGKSLGHGEPIKVRHGERVMLRILNASATENIQLALPGHQFEVVALDGNLVPNPRKVSVLSLGTAERIDAIVTMDHPGVWVLGTPRDDDRQSGFGIVVEYRGANGKPQWQAPPAETWDYTVFGRDEAAAPPDETITLNIGKIDGGPHGFNKWTINGATFEESTPILIRQGRRYRLVLKNGTDDAHPLHLHRHLFELTKIDGKRTSGVMKDTVLVKGFGTVEVDFVADNPGLTLFHCHQQLHMDYGFMRLFKYI